MSRKALLYTAASLAMLTCIVHLIGTYMPIPPEQTEVARVVATMNATLVPMPVGSAKTYLQILNGNNLGTALLLLVCSAQLVGAATSGPSAAASRAIAITAAGLVGFAVISFTHFFPIPALFTGVAAALSIAATRAVSTGGPSDAR